MKSLADIYEVYRSHNPDGPGTGDKGTVHSYIEVYEELFLGRRERIKHFLEIGVLAGSSIRMWTDYFHGATVYGIDIDECPLNGLFDLRPMVREGFNLKFFDASLPGEVAKNFPGVSFDAVIDDASHLIEHQLANYAHIKPLLSKGSIYIIEDVANIDRDRSLFESIDPEKDIAIIDRRSVKGRFDDVLVVITDRK